MGDASSGHSPGVKLSPDTREKIEEHKGRAVIRVARVHLRHTQHGCALPCSERAGVRDRGAGKPQCLCVSAEAQVSCIYIVPMFALGSC